MKTSFAGIPVSMDVIDGGQTCKYLCHACLKKIQGVYLYVVADPRINQQCYCSKCARKYIESVDAKFKFFSSQLNNIMIESFPKAKKEKHDDINIISTL